MHKSTSSRPKSFKRIAIATSALVGIGAASALLAGVSPAMAANIAAQPDTQIAVFMVPLTILVLVMLYEATRIVLRGKIPAEAPLRRRARQHWTATRRKA